jgi:hypothetical protein
VPVALARTDSLIQVRIPAGTIGVYLKEDLPEFGEKKPWTGLRIAY